MKKLKDIINEIGFRDRMSKSVDDESKAEFQNFGEYVGSLYQRFQTKDLSAEPAIAQKIRDFVSVEDAESELINKIKDLEYLINQLPNKPEKKDKIGFREGMKRYNYRYDESFQAVRGLIDVISQNLNMSDDSEIKQYARDVFGLDSQEFDADEIRDEIDNILVNSNDEEIKNYFKKYFGSYADEIAKDAGLSVDEAMYGTATHDAPEYSKIEKAWDNLSRDEQMNIIADAMNGEPRPNDYEKGFDQLKSEIPDFESAIANYVGIDEMTNNEFEKAKEADRLEKHPEKDKIKKIQQLIRKQIKELSKNG